MRKNEAKEDLSYEIKSALCFVSYCGGKENMQKGNSAVINYGGMLSKKDGKIQHFTL